MRWILHQCRGKSPVRHKLSRQFERINENQRNLFPTGWARGFAYLKFRWQQDGSGEFSGVLQAVDQPTQGGGSDGFVGKVHGCHRIPVLGKLAGIGDGDIFRDFQTLATKETYKRERCRGRGANPGIHSLFVSLHDFRPPPVIFEFRKGEGLLQTDLADIPSIIRQVAGCEVLNKAGKP